MTSIDPLAGERFRTILGDRLHDIDLDFDGVDVSTGDLVDRIIDEFPQAHFEYRVNEAGVRVRKVVVESREESDPNQDSVDPIPERSPRSIVEAAREDYANARAIADGLQDRLRAAITDAVAEHGMESREHQRLRWVLTDERPVEDDIQTA